MRSWLARSPARRWLVFTAGSLIVLSGRSSRSYEDMYGHGYNFVIESQGGTTKVYNQGDPTVMFEGDWDEAVAYTDRMMDEGDNFLPQNLVIAGGTMVAALSLLPRPRADRRGIDREALSQ